MSEYNGLRIVITRPRQQARSFKDELESRGAVPILVPAIEIQFPKENTRLDRALKKLNCFEWMVVTSVNGVKALWKRFQALEIAGVPASLKVAAIGPKTAQALVDQGVSPDFVPDEYIAEAILPGLGDVRGRWVLLPRAELARPALTEMIREQGGFAHEIPAYYTLPGKIHRESSLALKQGVDLLTFTSSSTVRNFIRLVRQEGLDPLVLAGNPAVACIGPITAATAREGGYQVDAVAEDYTIEGLLEIIPQAISEKRTRT